MNVSTNQDGITSITGESPTTKHHPIKTRIKYSEKKTLQDQCKIKQGKNNMKNKETRPWETIKRAYTHGLKDDNGVRYTPSLKELAEEYGIPEGTIYSRKSREDWEKYKVRFHDKVREKVENKKTELEATEIVEGDLLCESIGLKGLRLVSKKLDKLDELLEEGKWVSGYELMNNMSAAKTAQEIMKTSQGDNVNQIRLEATQDVKLNITDPDFMDAELEFANKLIDRRLGGTTD